MTLADLLMSKWDKMADLRYIIIKLNREVKNVQVPYSLGLGMGSMACDPYHKECEWVLTAEPEGIKMMAKQDVENNLDPSLR